MTSGPVEPIEPIAIVGLACRLPGAGNTDDYWSMLCGGIEAVVPSSRAALLEAGLQTHELDHPQFVNAAALASHLEGFDAGLFGMTRHEASLRDPQVCLFTEVVHAGIENAGYDVTRIREATGVFGSCGPRQHHELVDEDPLRNASDMLAAPVSEILGLRGPTVTAPTAALSSLTAGSGSLAAVHLATQSLLVGECDMAVAGGVHVQLPHGLGYRWRPGDIRSPDGHCRPFDAAAAGTVFGSGAACVVLKRLSDAVADGDDVRALILGSAVSGYGPQRDDNVRQPPKEQDSSAIVDALAIAGRAPHEVSFVEADGTGVPDHDRAAVTALRSAFEHQMGRVSSGSVVLSSVKANIGHLAWAAGVAALVKVVLALDREQIPPSINYSAQHPTLRLDESPFVVDRASRPWRREADEPRRAVVHAHGPSGANGCLVVQEGIPHPTGPADGRPRIVVWSGRSPEAVDAARERLAAHFATVEDHDFQDVVATLRQGRTAHPYRAAAVTRDPAEASAQLRDASLVAIRSMSTSPPEAGRNTVLLFPHEPLLATSAGAGLYGTERVFTETMDLCFEASERHNVRLYDRWLANDFDLSDDPAHARVLMIAIQYALAKTWTSWGIRPTALVGHGLGEVAAALAAETMDIGDAVRLVTGASGRPPGRAASEVATRRPRVPVYSGTSGCRQPEDALLDPSAWAARASEPVQADRVMAAVQAAGGDHVISMGSDDTLHSVSDGPSGGVSLAIASVTGRTATLHGDQLHLRTAAAALWVHGHDLDWSRIDSDAPLQRVSVPGYPYQRERCWTLSTQAPTDVSSADVLDESDRNVVAELPGAADQARPLDRVQRAFWILEQLAPDSGVSNIGIAFRTARPLRWWPLHQAVQQLVARHPPLRLRFPTVNGVPVQHVTAPGDVEVTLDTRATTDEDLTEDLRSFLHSPFDLERQLPFRVAHFSLANGASVVCLGAHHIAVDAASMQILVEEVGRLYDGIAEQGQIPADLASEAASLSTSEPAAESMRYWLDRLRDLDPAQMALPGTRPAPSQPTFAGHTYSVQLSPEAIAALADLRRELRVTDNIILLSTFLLTLLCHGAGPELIVGIPISRRTPATRNEVGYGVSTMPLRIRPDPAAGFRDLVSRTADAFLEGVEHSDATVEAILTEHGHSTADWRVPLFRQMFNYRPWTDAGIRICGQVPQYIEDLFDRSRLDLQCIAVPEPDRFTLRAWYSTEIYDQQQVAAFLARMEALLVAAATQPERPLDQLPFSTAADRAVVAAVNETERSWDSPATLLGSVAAHIAATPDATAIVEPGNTVSYGLLGARAMAVSAALRTAGVQPGDVVAIALSRGAWMAAAILGVWTAGAAYAPLDVEHPPDRLAYAVEDTDARVVILGGEPPEWTDGRRVVDVDACSAGPADGPLNDRPSPEDAAYVIHTSGSTGRPKGIVVTHRNLRNVVQDFVGRLDLDASKAVSWSTTTTFDISALELLLPLSCGGRVVVIDHATVLRPRAFLDAVRRHDVSVVQATPTLWRLVADEVTDELAGRQLLCGGEPLTASLARRLIDTGARLFNVYGPTETTIWSTVAELRSPLEEPVSIGRPISNTRVFVVDQHLRELPPGVPGELCVAGDGVSAGYWRRPTLTAANFGEHPRYGRYYRTGDRACIRGDGSLEVAGRLDRQLKLRGHRVEPGEVEAVLEEHEGVVVAAVTVVGDTESDRHLCAVVQPREHPAPTAFAEQVWRHASSVLPGYAVPSDIVVVEAMATTPNGKIDYGSLSALVDVNARRTAVEPGRPPAVDNGSLVGQLVQIWRETLGCPELDERDNFFLHGGHSLSAVRMTAQIERIAGRPLPVTTVFHHPTPADLAAHLRSATGSDPVSGVDGDR